MKQIARFGKIALAVLLFIPLQLRGDEPQSIEVYPPSITLHSQRSQTQIVVTGNFANGETRDLTRSAAYASDQPAIAEVKDAKLFPKANGSTSIKIRVGALTAQIPVVVTYQDRPDPIQFRAETLAALTKQGCNAGSCHGSPEGKGGFKLSMQAYAPHIDEESLIQGDLARRVQPIQPEESLLLKKPLLRVSHVGGKKLRKTDTAYQVLHDWIREGAKPDPDGTPECTKIFLRLGPFRILRAPYLQQQLSVLAHFSDDSLRDVTPLAMYETSNKEIAEVDANGLVTGKNRGQVAITIRYLKYVESIFFTVVENVDGFAWTNSPETNYVDTLVNAKLKQLQFLPSDTCDDSTFIRRIYLDLTGLLPDANQVRNFLTNAAADKRAKLIDELLVSDEFAYYWAQKSADLMRVSKAVLNDGRAELFAQWIANSYRTNQPFDQFARDVLTSTGDTKAIGPANYFFAIPTNEDLTETTAQLFMGSRINCAKCHNHPFEAWTQDDYYRIAAVFVRTKKDGDEIATRGNDEARHPATGQVMRPWGLEATQTVSLPNADRRDAFAQWLTKRGNPFFSRVEVNRLWSHLLGRGIVHPVDDFRSSNPPANPELLDALATDFESHGFDRKHILRTICNSRTYQRSATTNKFNETDSTLFSHYYVRRLGAEQLQDAIGYATRTLFNVQETPERINKLEEIIQLRANQLLKEHDAWEKQQRDRIAKWPLWTGPWHVVGPFPAADVNKARTDSFPPEQKFDLAQTYLDGKLNWRTLNDLADRQQWKSSASPGVTYLSRRLFAREAGTLKVEFGSDAANKLWLDGKVLLDDNRRPFKAETHKLEIPLQPGEHQLLIKLTTPDKNFTFQFTLDKFNEKKLESPGIPLYAVEQLANSSLTTRRANKDSILDELSAKPPSPLTGEPRNRLIAWRQEQDGQVKGTRQQIEQFHQRQSFQTQRPYPEQSQFLRAFGQPKRESPCACERSSDPTIDQALQTLNGVMVGNATGAGSAIFAKIPDDLQVVNELYLSALARFPTAKECETVQAYLTKKPNRAEAIQDLLWALVNTQEFEFQH